MRVIARIRQLAETSQSPDAWDCHPATAGQAVVTKAKTACEQSGQSVSDHFGDAAEMVDITLFDCYFHSQLELSPTQNPRFE